MKNKFFKVLSSIYVFYLTFWTIPAFSQTPSDIRTKLTAQLKSDAMSSTTFVSDAISYFAAFIGALCICFCFYNFTLGDDKKKAGKYAMGALAATFVGGIVQMFATLTT